MIKKWTILSILIGLAISLVGCEAVKKGTSSTIGFVRGEYRDFVAARVDAACSATMGALDELKIPVQEQSCDALTGRIVGKTAQGDKVTITLTREDTRLTRVAIQVGAMGDEAISRTIFQNIQENL